jgi:two-component system sensor histidine kinase RegB
MSAWDDTQTTQSAKRDRTSNLPYDIDARMAINVRGVIALRWVAFIGQLLTILVVHSLLAVELPLRPLFIALGATATLNAGLMIVYRLAPSRFPALTGHTWQHILGLTLLFDLIDLTALVSLTGGMANPFSLFFFVNMTLAAIILSRRWVWGLTLFGVLCVGLVNLWFQPLAGLEFSATVGSPLPMGTNLARLGSFIAVATCGSVIVLFITRIRGQIELLEARVRELAQAKARSERLDSLGTLAAGAAHELSSPLSTIAVITKEVERELVCRIVSDQTIADISTIRTELDRCRDILDRMSSDAGLVIGEALSTTTLGELIRECISGVDSRAPVAVAFDPAIETVVLRAPLEGLAQAIRGIVKNAVDAAGHPDKVTLHAALEKGKITMKIVDQGTGINAETLRRIGEPFFTTKEPGKGMGLGVYLARNLIQRLGGTIDYSSVPGRGTVVAIEFPQEFSAIGNSSLPDTRSPGVFF